MKFLHSMNYQVDSLQWNFFLIPLIIYARFVMLSNVCEYKHYYRLNYPLDNKEINVKILINRFKEKFLKYDNFFFNENDINFISEAL